MQTQNERERERRGKKEGGSKEDERLHDEERIKRLSRPLALFRDNPISLRRFPIFTTSFELVADSVADGHSKYSRNLVFTLAAGGKSGGKDATGVREAEGEKGLPTSRVTTGDQPTR